MDEPMSTPSTEPSDRAFSMPALAAGLLPLAGLAPASSSIARVLII